MAKKGTFGSKLDPKDMFLRVFNAAAHLPLVNIDREQYLSSALSQRFEPELVAQAVQTSPARAGIEPEELHPIANASIRYEAAKVTALSAAAGLPGSIASVATIPADIMQYYVHVMRIAQKLAFLYGWESLFGEEQDMDNATKESLILFMGIMFGIDGACEAIEKIAEKATEAAVAEIPTRAITDLQLYRVAVEPICAQLGIYMNQEIFGAGVARLVPLFGALVSGGLTLASFAPICLRLRDDLAGLDLADPEMFVIREERE